MQTSDFDYALPRRLIAQTPIEPRDHSRLLVLDRSTGRTQHRRFYEIGDHLRRGDVLVVNDSRVMPARLLGHRLGSGGAVEVLLLHRVSPGTWRALVKPGKRLRPGAKFEVDGTEGEVLADAEGGTRLVWLSDEGVIHRAGQVPLPPYIRAPLADAERYQTVYAREEGSSAAPTAGLHFTGELMAHLEGMGVRFVRVTLHVGLGSFRPVKAATPEHHELHSEYFELSEEAAREINLARSEGRRVISVGTTTVRALEQAALRSRRGGSIGLVPTSGWADLFILPGHTFRVVDGLVTNFHLPRSTLLMLVCAFAGDSAVMEAYRAAAGMDYRFYSFGDGMLLL